MEEQLKKTRKVVRLELEISTADELDKFCKKTRRTKVGTVSKILDWFFSSDSDTKLIIMGENDDNKFIGVTTIPKDNNAQDCL